MSYTGLRDHKVAREFYQAIDGEAILLRRDPAFTDIQTSSDWDFVVSDPERAEAILNDQLGPPIVSIRRHYVVQHYYEWGQVDFLPTMMWRGAAYLTMDRIWSRSEKDQEGILRPCLAHDALLAWLTALFAGGRFNPRHRELVLEAYERDLDELGYCLQQAVGKKWKDVLVDLLEQGDPGMVVQYTTELRRALRWQKFRERPMALVLGVFQHWAREWKLHWSSPMPMIAFLGPDGSGKSSVIQGVNERLHRMRLHSHMQHWRPYGFKGREDLGQPVSDPHANKPRGIVTSTMKLGMLFWDWWSAHLTVLKHARSKNSIVISDRYYQDMLADPIRYRYGASLELAYYVFKFFPRPDKTIILVGSAEVIHKRKEEVTFNELTRQLVAYRDISQSLGVRATLIDVDQPLEEVVDEAWKSVLCAIKRSN